MRRSDVDLPVGPTVPDRRRQLDEPAAALIGLGQPAAIVPNGARAIGHDERRGVAREAAALEPGVVEAFERAAVLADLEPDVLVVGEDRHWNRQPHPIAARQPHGLPDLDARPACMPLADLKEPRALADDLDDARLAEVRDVEADGQIARRGPRAPTRNRSSILSDSTSTVRYSPAARADTDAQQKEQE